MNLIYKSMRNFLKQILYIVLTGAIFFALFTGIAFAARSHYQGKSYPHFYLANTLNIGGKTEEEINQILEERLTKFNNTPFEFRYVNKTIKILPVALGINFDKEKLLKQIEIIDLETNLINFLEYTLLKPPLVIEAPFLPEEIETRLRTFIPELTNAQNAKFELNEKGEIILVHGTEGVKINIDNIIEELKEDCENLEPGKIEIQTETVAPEITKEMVDPYFEELKESINRTITIKNDSKNWEFDFKKNINSLSIKILVKPKLKIDKKIIEDLLKTEILPKVYNAPTGVKIYKNEKENIIFEGSAHNGQTADTVKLVALINAALNDISVYRVKLPIRVLHAEVDASPELKALGIEKLIATGHTTYYRSPINRRYNIKLGTNFLNAKLIPPGEIFSFNEAEGPVVARRGFLEELVIKEGNDLEREIGGGICQVSTTLYRAALNAGFPIIERWGHSFAVLYYAQVGGHGIDATVYPPSRDLKFKNDTPGYILIQSYTEGLEAFFNLYGTDDGRTVELDGPYYPSFKSIGGGFETMWYQYITKNGETTTEKIYTKYGAIPVEDDDKEEEKDKEKETTSGEETSS